MLVSVKIMGKHRKKQIVDIHGRTIKSGDIVRNTFNGTNGHQEFQVLSEEMLYLGDFDSPLEKFYPEKYWEIISR